MDSQQGVVLQLGGWARCQQLTVETGHYETESSSSGLDCSFGTNLAMENEHEIWYVGR
jgi:hypothetical protein